MYSKLADSSAYLARAGSHATKGTRTGITDQGGALGKEEIYISLRRQCVTSYLAHRRLQRQLEELNARIKRTRRGAPLTALKRERERIRSLFQEVASKYQSQRHAMKRAGEDAYCTVFYYVAQAMLRGEMFRAVDEEARTLMQRVRHQTWEQIVQDEARRYPAGDQEK